jgi:hypothetical protein
MKIEIKTNNTDECYDLIDVDSDQSHDGDNAKELVAKVYEYPYAFFIADYLNKLGMRTGKIKRRKNKQILTILYNQARNNREKNQKYIAISEWHITQALDALENLERE